VLKGDIPLPRPRPTNQQISEANEIQAKIEAAEAAKDRKAAKAAAKKSGQAAKKEAVSESEDDGAAKKRKSKHKG
jgi:hypothetical protein